MTCSPKSATKALTEVDAHAEVLGKKSRLFVLKDPVRRDFEELESVSLPRWVSRFLAHNAGAARATVLSLSGQKDFDLRSLDQRRHADGEESSCAYVVGCRGVLKGLSLGVLAAQLEKHPNLQTLVLAALRWLGSQFRGERGF